MVAPAQDTGSAFSADDRSRCCDQSRQISDKSGHGFGLACAESILYWFFRHWHEACRQRFEDNQIYETPPLVYAENRGRALFEGW